MRGRKGGFIPKMPFHVHLLPNWCPLETCRPMLPAGDICLTYIKNKTHTHTHTYRRNGFADYTLCSLSSPLNLNFHDFETPPTLYTFCISFPSLYASFSLKFYMYQNINILKKKNLSENMIKLGL